MLLAVMVRELPSAKLCLHRLCDCFGRLTAMTSHRLMWMGI